MRALAATLLVSLTALAGCTDDGPSGEDPGLASGTGAIAGLVVDDRFRPIRLTDTPQTEFDASGFVLLQETGQQAQTNENGEFTFVDLEPGTYTLRASIGGHESVPQQVQVVQGEFAETSIVARRIVSDSGIVISNEYAAFVPCGANIIAFGSSFDCTLDQSGDTSRESFLFNYTGLDATHVVMEMRSNSPQYFDVWLQPEAADQFVSCDQTYQIMGGPDTTYLRFQLDLGESAVSSPGASGADCETLPWNNDRALQTVVYLNSLGFEEGAGFGLGVYTGVQANFVQSVFIGEPEVDVDSYCVYC